MAGSYWGALGQVGGGVMEYEAADQRARQLSRLNKFQKDGRTQVDQWADQDRQRLIDTLRGLTAQRYASQGRLASDISGPGRVAAGDAARDRANSLIGRALVRGDVAPVGNRAEITGNDRGFRDWRAASNARFQPVMDARRNLLLESRAQRGLTHYDTEALDRQADTSLDLNRQAQEAQQRSNLLAQYRKKLLTQLGVDYADPGPTRSQQNLAMWAGVSRAAGAMADSYMGGSGGNAEISALGYNPDSQDRGSYVTGYTYNPY